MLGKRVRSWAACAPLLVAVLGFGGCTSPHDVYLAQRGAEVTFDATSIEAFYKEQQDIHTKLSAMVEKGTTLEERNRQFLRLGYTYVDRNCESYFNSLTRIQRDRQTTTAEVALIGAAAGGVLAALKASAKAIALVGIGTGFTAASIETITGGVLYELDASTTRTLTFKALQKYQEEAPPPKDIGTFADAVFILQGYGEICLPPTIEAMVKSAVKSASPENLTRSSGRDSFLGTIAQQRADELAAFLGVSRIGDRQLVILYWLFDQGGIDEPAVVKELLPALGATLAEKLIDTKSFKAKEGADIRGIQLRLDAISDFDSTPRKEAVAAREKYLAEKNKAVIPGQGGHRTAGDVLLSMPARGTGLLNRPLIGVR